MLDNNSLHFPFSSATLYHPQTQITYCFLPPPCRWCSLQTQPEPAQTIVGLYWLLSPSTTSHTLITVLISMFSIKFFIHLESLSTTLSGMLVSYTDFLFTFLQWPLDSLVSTTDLLCPLFPSHSTLYISQSDLTLFCSCWWVQLLQSFFLLLPETIFFFFFHSEWFLLSSCMCTVLC